MAINPKIDPKDEYKTLRDEMLHLYNRVLVVFIAMFTGYATMDIKAVEQQTSAFLCLVMMGVLSTSLISGLLLITAFYRNMYSIGSYIAVYLEEDSAGWILRSRHMRMKLRNHDDRIPIIEKMNESQTLSFVVLLMFFSMPLEFFVRFGPKEAANHKTGLILLISSIVIGCVLIWRLSQVYSIGAKKWMKRWLDYRIDIEPNMKPSVEMLLETQNEAMRTTYTGNKLE